MDMDDAWEALDVDDSDLVSLRPSTFLPCKRPLPLPLSLPPKQNPNKTKTNTIFSSLQPCSQSKTQEASQRLILTQKRDDLPSTSNHHLIPGSLQPCSQSKTQESSQMTQRQPCSQFKTQESQRIILTQRQPCSQSKTQESQRITTLNQKRDDLPSTSNHRLIPGPAGILQARKARVSSRIEEDQIPTQEFIRRMNGEDEGENDPDFKRNPWLSAVEFDMGFEEGKSTLGSINKRLTNRRISLVIALVKSCKPSGLGDLILALKDPTGTIGANVHRKVTESEYGKDISVGCVLILKKVVLFSPSRKGHYLNITLPNLVKVISKDYSGPPIKGCLQQLHSSRPIDECNKSSLEMAEKVSFVRSGATDKRHTNKELLVDGDDNRRRQPEESRAARGNSQRGSSYEPAAEIGIPFKERSITNQATQLTVRGGDMENEVGIMDLDDNCTSKTLQHISTASKFSDHLQHQEHERGSGSKKPTISLPEWTDEQLNELFTANSDDGDTFLL